jgi:hypothetical protein
LDVAQGRDDAEALLQMLTRASTLPPDSDPRASALLATAVRICEALRIAALDDGASVSASAAATRRELLGPLAATARRTVEAATAACAGAPDRLARP